MSSKLLQAFLSEARELLEQIASLSLALEQQGQDADTLNELFRAVHTLKGASGLFEVPPLIQVVHAAEDVLSQVRDGEHTLNPDDMDLLLDAMDQVGGWLDELERNGELSAEAVNTGQRLSQALRQLLTAPGAATEAATANPAPAAAEPPPAWLDQVPAAQRRELAQGGACVAIDYQPDEQCFFQGQDPLLIIQQLPALAWWQIAAREPWPELAEFDPYRCILQIQALAQTELEAVQQHLRYVLDQVSLTVVAPPTLDPEQAAPAAAEPAAAEPSPPLAAVAAVPPASDPIQEMAAVILREQRELLAVRASSELWPGRVASVATVLQRVLPVLDAASEAETVSTATRQASERTAAEPLTALIDRALEAVASPPAAAAPAPAEPLAAEAGVAEAGPDMPSAPAPEAAPAPAAEPAAPPREDQRQRVLKVDAERIDALMDLVGELIVAKNALPFLAKRAGEEFKVKPLGKEIKSHFAVINRIAEELQGAVMQVRMVPVGTAFQRFPRLVRDVSRKLGKEVQLDIQGEDTEADKNVVADLAEPLIHLVRNALDHGLETPADRLATGKSEQGRLQIKAHQQEDRVFIEINDDGRGMDPQVIKRKAYEKGLLSEEALERIDDREALQLIFAPGFSTAQAISDLSGRGVGMDVVRTAVQNAGGEVTLDSELGMGTTVCLSVPLSMTVTQVMMIQVAGEDLGLVFEAVRETVRIPAARVQRIKQREAVVLRERLLPLYRLDHLLGLSETACTEPRAAQELAIIVVATGGQELGLIVDDVREGVDVILKPLEGVMTQFPLYAGTALLGDGRVLLVLNLKELLRCL